MEVETEEQETENGEESDEQFANPTPAMKALISKRKSIAAAGSAKSPARKPAQASAKAKPVSKSPKKPLAAPPKPPRLEFLGRDESRIYLMCGEPLELSLPRIVKAIPLSVHFPGAHLSGEIPLTYLQDLYKL